MLEEMETKDKLLRELVIRSSFKKKQLDYLLVRCLTDKDLKLSDKIKASFTKPLTKPAFVITEGRGRNKIIRAIYTLLVAQYLGLIPLNSLNSLEKVSEILANARNKELSKGELEMILLTLEQFSKRILLR